MKPFFSYYGAKYTVAGKLEPPKRDVVIEPFAGSACYSTRWNVQRAKLFDVSEEICTIWDFLIKCSVADILKIPSSFEHIDEVMDLPEGPRNLVRFWIAKGRAEPSGQLSPWYFKWRDGGQCRVWSYSVKARLISQKPGIADWTITNATWQEIPFEDAHWHVDPPYNNNAGSRYPHSSIDFRALGYWCRHLPGYVEAFENVGASWLPFEHLCDVTTSRGRRTGAVSQEAIWRSAA